MYHVNEGKMDALVARFRDHTDTLFKKRNMKSIGYWKPEDAPNSQNLLIYILEHQAGRKRRRIGPSFRPNRKCRDHS